MIDNRGEFRRFWESKTGFFWASLMLVSALVPIVDGIQTDPRSFPDLKSRFKIVRSLDLDGINKLSVYRADSSPVNWYDNDLVALERSTIVECGNLSKFTGVPDSQG